LNAVDAAAPQADAFFAGQAECCCLGPDGRPTLARTPAIVLSGSFNPVHAGHWGLAAAAARHLGAAVDFELSILNVDKPALAAAAALERSRRFAGRASLWLTRAPTFVQKARLFPGAVFVVGADTAARVVAARYYAGGSAALESALDTIHERGCRFLVACRADPAGRLLGLEDLDIPGRHADLFEALPAGAFRLDLSSTQLRAQPG
jgi:hypothetical protein